MPKPLLQVCDLTVRLGTSVTTVLKRLNLQSEIGESIAILGDSGCGKTTLARGLLRLLPASARMEGSAFLRGRDILRMSDSELQTIRGAQISLIPQEPELSLNPFMRVRDQTEAVLRAHVSMPHKKSRYIAEMALNSTGLPASLHLSYPHQLSGGQRQRVVIAQALVCGPSLLIADELASALDVVVQAEILRQLKQLVRDLKLGLLFITHDPGLARKLADRVIVIRDGAIVESGSFQQVLQSANNPYTAKLMHSLVPPPAFPDDTKRVVSPEIAPFLEMREVTKTYVPGKLRFRGRRTTCALDHVTLKLRAGSTLGLVGKSGSGKSTLARCLALLEQPDSGEVNFRGQSLLNGSRRELRSNRTKIQLVWQHSALALNSRLLAVDIVAEPLRITKSGSKTESRDQALEMMAKLGLPLSLAIRTTLALSGGQRQRVALARALVLCPAVLILDEAFAGLDLPLQSEIAELLLKLKTSWSLSCLFITHDLRRAASFADELAVMENGKIVEQGDPRKLFWKPEHDATRELVQATQV